MAQNKNEKSGELSKWLKKQLGEPARGLYYFLGLLFLISLTGIIIFAESSAKDTFERTITDTLLTIISTGIIGTVIALLLKNHEQTQSQLETARENRQLRRNNLDQYRKDTLRNLNESYAKIKNARRMLRAKGLSMSYKKQDDNNLLYRSEYDIYMNDINNAQFELEALRDQVSNRLLAFSDPQTLIDEVHEMDKYLSELISEYEEQRPKFVGEPPTLRIKKLSKMKKFLANVTEDKDFQNNFSNRFKEIRKMLRIEINLFDDRAEKSSSATRAKDLDQSTSDSKDRLKS